MQDQDNAIFCYCEDLLSDDAFSLDIIFCEITRNLAPKTGEYKALQARASFKRWNEAISYRATSNEESTIF